MRCWPTSCRATDKWSHRLIVTSDQDAEAVGLAFGCALVADPGEGLNAAVAAGTEAATAAGTTTLLILPSDVPMVSPDDVNYLFSCSEEVVVAPSGDGGTNALLRRPPQALTPSFGPGSAERHRRSASLAGLNCRTVEMSSLVLDIDHYEDLVTLGGLANLRESVRLARELSVSDLVLDQAGALDAPLEQVAKAASLARLVAAGFPVPAFFVVTSTAFENHLAGNGIAWPSGDDPVRLAEAQESICASAIPQPVAKTIRAAHNALAGNGPPPAVAVRSSGATEDSGPASFAGQFASELNVPAHDLEAAIRRCWASSLSAGSVAYRSRRGIPLGSTPNFALLVQRQLFAVSAGVLFTRHPLDQEGDVAYIEANFGTGESVVAGMVTPDSYTLLRRDHVLVESRVGSKKRMTVASEDAPGSRVVETDQARRRESVLTVDQAGFIGVFGGRNRGFDGRTTRHRVGIRHLRSLDPAGTAADGRRRMKDWISEGRNAADELLQAANLPGEMAGRLRATAAAETAVEPFIDGAPERLKQLGGRIEGLLAGTGGDLTQLLGERESEASQEITNLYRIALKFARSPGARQVVVDLSANKAFRSIEANYPQIAVDLVAHLQEYGWVRTVSTGLDIASPKDVMQRIQVALLRWDAETLAGVAEPPTVVEPETPRGVRAHWWMTTGPSAATRRLAPRFRSKQSGLPGCSSLRWLQPSAPPFTGC